MPCLALPCLALPCLALPCLALPCLATPGRAQPRQARPRPASPSPAQPSRAQPRQARPRQAAPSPARPRQAAPCLAQPRHAWPGLTLLNLAAAVPLSAPASTSSRLRAQHLQQKPLVCSSGIPVRDIPLQRIAHIGATDRVNPSATAQLFRREPASINPPLYLIAR